MVIDLASYLEQDVKLLLFRDQGQSFLSNFEKDFNFEILEKEDFIELIFPLSIESVGAGFFLEVFGQCVYRLGKQGFKDKYILHLQPHIIVDIFDNYVNYVRSKEG